MLLFSKSNGKVPYRTLTYIYTENGKIYVENEDAHDAQQNQSRPSKMRIMHSPRGR